jgi:hypothetical protein
MLDPLFSIDLDRFSVSSQKNPQEHRPVFPMKTGVQFFNGFADSGFPPERE